jgi:hypothetical protein
MQAFPPPLRYEPLARDNVNSGSSYSSSLLLPRVSAMPTVLPAPVLDVRDGDVRQTLADRESELLDLRDKHDDEVMRLKTALRAKELELRRRSDDTLTPTSMRPADRSVMHTGERESTPRRHALLCDRDCTSSTANVSPIHRARRGCDREPRAASTGGCTQGVAGGGVSSGGECPQRGQRNGVWRCYQAACVAPLAKTAGVAWRRRRKTSCGGNSSSWSTPFVTARLTSTPSRARYWR